MGTAPPPLIWASKGKRACHTFNYTLIDSLDPTARAPVVCDGYYGGEIAYPLLEAPQQHGQTSSPPKATTRKSS
jgi:hypothetical protein